MKKKDIQKQYNISERLFWRLITENKIIRISYRDYELDEEYFKTFSTAKFWEEYKNRPEVKERRAAANLQRSATMKEHCANPEVRQLMSDRAKEANARLEVREKISKSVRATLSTQEVKDKLSNKARAYWSNEEHRQQQSIRLRKAYEDAELRQKISRATKDALSNPEVRKRLSENTSKALLRKWSDGAWRANRLAKMHQESYSKALSKGLRNFWSNEDNRVRALQKQYNTKKKNNSFKSSSTELALFELLKELFGEDDVTHLLKSHKDKRYPYECDFYIKSLDLFIEFNDHWTHGPGFYDKTNEAHQKLLTFWESKASNSKYYQHAIDVWTKRDIEKLQCAKDNNLNYLAFFNFKEAIHWIGDMSGKNTNT